MSAFTLIFIFGLVSLIIHRLNLLKSLSILILAISSALVLSHYVTPLNGFVSSSGIELFEVLMFVVLGAVILSEDEAINITQILFIASASILLLESNTLLTFVISFEAVSIISSVLVSNIKNAKEAEGAVKMFISASIATAIILLGLTFYALEGHSLNSLIDTDVKTFAIAGIWIVMMGLFYKLSIVPMHTWAADSYAQVRPSHAAILSGIVKSVVVIATFKIFSPFILNNIDISMPILVTLALVTMTLGNFLALFQKNIGRILSYSSIAHAGYMLLAFVAVESTYASTALLYMAIAYIFMQSSLFLLLDKLSNGSGNISLKDLKGLVQRDRFVALIFTIELFSLAGIPLLAGFIGKAIVVYAVVDADFIWVALFTLLNSALSVGYYAWIIKHIYFDKANSNSNITAVSKLALYSQIILLLATLYFGIFAYKILSLTI
jgi:NADH-quinone oxidoreductase subunit N